jgi:hypothetical protein
MSIDTEEIRPNKLIPNSFRKPKPFEQELREAKKSWGYWWYAALQLSDGYIRTCERKGEGPCADLYADLGDVRLPFATWWLRYGRKAFSEGQPKREVIKLETPRQADDHLESPDHIVIAIPLKLSRTTAMKKIGKLLSQEHEKRGALDIWKASTAKRMIIKTKVRKETVKQLVALWKLRQQFPDETLSELGKRANIVLDLLARDTEGEVITEAMERRRLTIAVSRQLLQAENMIANAAVGIFPLLKPVAST